MTSIFSLRLTTFALALSGALVVSGCNYNRELAQKQLRHDAFDIYAAGLLAEGEGQYQEALDYYLAAMEKEPAIERAGFLTKAGEMHQRLGNERQALEYYKRALAIEPEIDLADVNRSLIETQLAEPKPEPAEPTRSELLEARAKDDPASFQNFIFPELFREDLDEVAKLAEQAESRNQWGLAAIYWERVEAQRPQDERVLLGKARSYAKTNRWQRAEAYFVDAAALFPSSAEIQYAWANALRERGELQEAQEKYEEVLRLEPAHVRALTNASATSLRLGQSEQAKRFAAEAIDVDPSFSSAYLNLALASDALGAPPEEITEIILAYIRTGGQKSEQMALWLEDLRGRLPIVSNP